LLRVDGQGRRHETDLREHARSLGLSVAAAVVLLFFGRWLTGGFEAVPPHRQLSPAQQAEDLRANARSECAAQVWRACLDDLDHANVLDKDGETKELRDLHDLAEKNAGAADAGVTGR
jgi:hypothetical protein